MRPWLGYIRVSFVGNRNGDRFRSPEEQRAAIEQWAARTNNPVEILPPELDQSGGTDRRPILQQALRRIEHGDAQGLVVAYLSRAARNVRLLLDLDERIRAAGGTLVSVAEESFDPTTPVGEFGRTVLAAVAQLELDTHRERFHRLRQDTVRRGIWANRMIPVGYRRNPTTRRLEPDPNIAPKVARAFRLAAQGEPTIRIARLVGLTPAGARRMLRNRVYLGELTIGPHTNPTAHPPLVDEPTWLAAQRRPPKPAPHGKERATRLLSGLLRCQSCGHVMTGAQVATCPKHHAGGVRCPAPAAITITKVADHVEQVVVAHLARWRLVGTPRTDERDRALRELETARKELSVFLEATRFANLDPRDAAKALQARADRVRQLEQQLATANTVARVEIDPANAWDTMPHNRRNHLLRSLLETIVVRPVGRGRNIPVDQRVRLVRAGAGIVPRPLAGVVPLPFLPLDDPRVLTVDAE